MSANSQDSSTGGDSGGNGAASTATATSATATSAASDLAGGFSTAVSLDQLPAVIADAADALSAAAQSESGSTAASASTAQPIKELQINLAPAELGSLQVTMRLADGKLSIVVEVAKTSTLQAIAGDRDAIAARLGTASTRSIPLSSSRCAPTRPPAPIRMAMRNPEPRTILPMEPTAIRPPAGSRPRSATARRTRRGGRARPLVAALAILLSIAARPRRDRRVCEHEMARAARNGMPINILYSVGLTETGRPALSP